MWLEEIAQIVMANAVTAVLAAAATASIFLLALAVSGLKLSRLWRRPMTETERRFRNVFAMMGEKRREELIASTARKHRCGRQDAMKHALEQRDRDARSWR